jgi:site-specific DNA recombinase
MQEKALGSTPQLRANRILGQPSCQIGSRGDVVSHSKQSHYRRWDEQDGTGQADQTQDEQKPVALRTAIYVRVSTDDQVDGYSLTTQEEACRKYAELKGWQVADVYKDEGYSGTTLQRPELIRMLADAKDGLLDVICVWKCDRFTRKTRDFLNLLDDLKQMEVRFASATQEIDTTTPMGEAIAVFISLVAEMERENIVARILPNMKKGAELGWWQGGTAPYGYRLIAGEKGENGRRLSGSHLEVVPEEAAVVQRIFQMCLDGQGVRTISLTLNAEGVAKPNGFEWSNTHIYKIVTSPIYMGHYVWNRRHPRSKRLKNRNEWIVKENLYDSIIDEETFEAVQRILQERKVGHVTRQLGSDYLLAGVLHCGKCGEKMVGARRTVNNRTKERRRSYRCSAAHYGKSRCKTNSVDAALVEQTAFSLITDLACEPEILHRIKSHVERLFSSAADASRSDELTQLRANLEEVRRKCQKLMDEFLDSDDIVAKRRYDELTLDAKGLELKIQKAEHRLFSSDVQASSVSHALSLLNSLNVVWDELSVPERRQLFQCVFDRMEVNDGFLTTTTPAEEFAPFLPPLAEPKWCLTWERNIKEMNSELLDLRGTKTIRAFARELGMSETHLGAVERGIDPMTDYVRGKIDAWRAGQIASV